MGSDASGGTRQLTTGEEMQGLRQTIALAPRRADTAGALSVGHVAMAKRVAARTVDKTPGEMALQGFADHGNLCAPQKLVQLVGYRDPNGPITRGPGRPTPKA